MPMKAFRLIGILLVSFLLLVSCAGTQQQSAQPAAVIQGTGPAEHHFSIGTDPLFQGSNLTVADRLIPWNRNAAQYAKETNSLYFYFMAGEGTPVEGVGEKIGDSCLAVFPDGTLMLIDANQDGYTPQLVANLKALGVSHIDYVLFSHPHSDHYMGFVNTTDGIMANFTVGKVYYNGTSSGGTDRIRAVCEQFSIPMEVLKEGDSLTIGGVSIDILNPTAAVSASTVSATAETNNSSIVMIFTYGSRKFMFTGDMYKAGLQNLVERYDGSALDVDFLKIPHHGHSETSILDAFAKRVSAEIAVASSGLMLNADVYGCYAKVGTKVLGDYMEGYIVVHSDGTKLEYETSRTRVTDYYGKLDDPSWKPAPITKADVSAYATGAFKVVSSAQELLDAIAGGEKNIILGADISLNGYNTSAPLLLNLDGVVLDMDGHAFTDVVSTTADIANKGQNTRSNLRVEGSDFAILNGVFTKTLAGGYALQINLDPKKSADAVSPGDHMNIVLDGLTFTNGGLDAWASTITIRNCTMVQPSENIKNFSTLMFTGCNVTLESGSFSNVSSYSYRRWFKLHFSKIYIRNGVSWEGSVLYSAEDSLVFLEK